MLLLIFLSVMDKNSCIPNISFLVALFDSKCNQSAVQAMLSYNTFVWINNVNSTHAEASLTRYSYISTYIAMLVYFLVSYVNLLPSQLW